MSTKPISQCLQDEINTIIDEWEAGGDKYRLVNLGDGPDVLQILVGDEWREETECYRWGSLTHRIKELRNSPIGGNSERSDNKSSMPCGFRWCTECKIEQCSSRSAVCGCVPHHTAIP